MNLPAQTTAPSVALSPGTARAARLMRALGPAASAVWAELSPDEADTLSAAMQNASPESRSGNDADELLRAVHRRPREAHAAKTGSDVWARLATLEPGLIARQLRHENPQVLAVILSRLQPDLAAETVRALPRSLATETLRRLLYLGPVRKPALAAIEGALSELLTSARQGGGRDGHEAVARIFDQLGSGREQALLASLDEAEPGSAPRIRALMFTFDDLAGLRPAAIQTILSSVDRAVLSTALRGAKPAVRKVFLQNMTKRAGDLLVAEIETSEPVRRSEIETARQEITGIARSLARRGDILSQDEQEDDLVE